MSHSRMESSIIGLPNQELSQCFGENTEYQFAFAELKGRRPTQEDALVWQTLDFSKNLLSPSDIAYRLWTTYLILDDALSKFNYTKLQGSTACTTVYDGRDHIILANLADSVSFIVFYDESGKPLRAKRLNTTLHKPEDTSEQRRIELLGGYIKDDRLAGVLAITRSFGDFSLNYLESSKNQYKMASAAPKLEIYSISEIVVEMHLTSIGAIHIINTCDGFTEPTLSDDALVHEHYLMEKLNKVVEKNPLAIQNPLHLAKNLTQLAFEDDSWDNITVAVQVLDYKQAFVMGIYDGHGGSLVSSYIAKHMLKELNKQFSIQNYLYSKQLFSVNTCHDFFNQDNQAILAPSVLERMHPLLREQYFQEELNLEQQEIIELIPSEILAFFRQKNLRMVEEKDLFLIHYSHPQLNIRVYEHLFKELGYSYSQLLQFGVLVNRIDVVYYAISLIPQSQFVSKKVLHEYLSQSDADLSNFPVNLELLFETSLNYGYITLCEYFLTQLSPSRANALIEEYQSDISELGIEVPSASPRKT